MNESDNVDVHIRGRVSGVKEAAGEARDTIRDLKEDVVSRAAEMAGVSGNLARTVAGVGTAFLAVGAAAYGTWKAYADGKAEVREMNLAIAKTGEYSGQSVTSLRALAGEMAATSALTIGEAKNIETALASSGRIGQEAFRSVSQVAGDFARVMGTDAAKIAPEMVKLFDDPAKGAAELNKTMHFLSAAELEHIEHLVRMGEVGEAQAELAVKLKDRLGDVVPQLGTLERAWNNLRGAASRSWDAMMDVGRPETLEDKLKVARTQLLSARAGLRGKDNVGELQANVDALEAQQAEQRDIAAGNAYWAEYSGKQNYARGLVNANSINAKARKIDDEIEAIRRYGGASEDAAQAIKKLQEQRDKLFEVKPAARTALDRMLEKGQKNQLDEYYSTGGEETMREVGEKRTLASAREAMLRDAEQQKLAARITHDLSADYRKTGEVRQRTAEAEQMTESQRRLASALNTVDDKARAAREALDLKFPDRERESTAYRAAVAEIDQAQLSAAQSAREWAADQDKLNASWEVGAVRGLKAYGEEAANVANRMASTFKRGAQMAEDAIANFVVKGKLDIRSLAEYAATEFAREKFAKPMISAGSDWLMGLFSGSGVGVDAMAGDAGLAAMASAGGAHSGAIVGAEATFRRTVPTSLFDRAPRFHTGGITGDEVPIIAKRGEGVFTREQMKNLSPASSGGVTVIINESPSQGGQVRQRDDGGRKIIEIMVAKVKGDLIQDVRSEGAFAKAAQSQWGLNRAAGSM